MMDADVLVVGGGPAGSSVAFALARAGVDVHVVDRARFPRPKPCAEYLSPEASRILAAMGALDAVETSGAAALTGIHVRAPNGAVITGDFIAGHGFRGFRDRGLSVRREVLDAILLDRARAAGARVTEGVRVTGRACASGDGRVIGVSTLDDGRRGEIRARVWSSAPTDCARSIAKRLGLAHTLRWPRRLALVTHYANVRDVGEHGEMHVERDGYVGIADVGNGLTTVALVVPARRVARDRRQSRRVSRRMAARATRISRRGSRDAERATPVVATGPFASHARRAWAPGAALVGDAADFFDPFTGEGIYAALRGGEMLAECGVRRRSRARTTRDADRAFAEYDAARRKEFRGKWIVERVDRRGRRRGAADQSRGARRCRRERISPIS